jgi:hypothetical protein
MLMTPPAPPEPYKVEPPLSTISIRSTSLLESVPRSTEPSDPSVIGSPLSKTILLLLPSVP